MIIRFRIRPETLRWRLHKQFFQNMYFPDAELHKRFAEIFMCFILIRIKGSTQYNSKYDYRIVAIHEFPLPSF